MAKAVRKVHRRSSRTNGRKTKVVRRWRRGGLQTRGPEVTRGLLLLEFVERRDKKDRRLTHLKLMLGSRSANFYDLHRVNQVIQHKIITKKIQRQAQERMEKEEECLLRLKKK